MSTLSHSSTAPTQEQLALLREMSITFWKDVMDEYHDQVKLGFNDFIELHYIKGFIADSLQTNTGQFYKTNVEKLTIDVGFPKAHYTENGRISFIQLRECDLKLRKLIIGCGNNPTTIFFHKRGKVLSLMELGALKGQFDNVYGANNPLCEKLWKRHQRENHLHHDAITCDVEVGMNPTFIGFAFIRGRPLPLPDHHFTKIFEEGITLEGLMGYNEENLRLLHPKYYNDPDPWINGEAPELTEFEKDPDYIDALKGKESFVPFTQRIHGSEEDDSVFID
jgi:hypothetical protein